MLESLTNDWLIGICSVLFDIDEGQKVLDTYPPGVIGDKEASDVAFHAFPHTPELLSQLVHSAPEVLADRALSAAVLSAALRVQDSLSAELHSRTSVRDSTFFFRLKRSQSETQEPATGLASGLTASKNNPYQRHYNLHRAGVLYGFVFCRQRHDDQLQRGAEQQSVVLLSSHPYSSVLVPLCQYAGPRYFNRGPEALQEVYAEVLEWPPPCSGIRSTVSIGGVRILSQVADSSTLPAPAPDVAWGGGRHGGGRHRGGSEELLGPFFEVDVFTPLHELLDQVWTLWEMTVLGQPLMVIAPTPGECSNAVAALLAIITPLPYGTDFRPYFTIHDPEYAALAAGSLPDNSNVLPRLLGVTNLYFLKALPAWPNVLAIGRRPSHVGGAKDGRGNANAGSPGPSQSRMARIDRAVRRRSAQNLLAEYSPSLWLAYKPLTRPSRTLLDRLIQPDSSETPAKAARVCAANSAALRKHFLTLTQALMQPLEALCQPGGGDSPLACFSHAAFLEGLADRSRVPAALLEGFPSHAACTQFYRRFLESPNFSSWLEARRQAALTADAHQRSLDTGALPATLVGLDEVQLVEHFGRLELRLERATSGQAQHHPHHTPAQVAAEEAAALKQEVLAVFEAMPRDLQHTVLSSPSRAALLHSLTQSRARVPGHVQAQLR